MTFSDPRSQPSWHFNDGPGGAAGEGGAACTPAGQSLPGSEQCQQLVVVQAECRQLKHLAEG